MFGLPARVIVPFTKRLADAQSRSDSLLCVGVFLMVVYSFFRKPAAEAPGFEPQMNADARR